MAGPSGIKRIVVGVDGSKSSEAALGWAIRMARGMGSRITAVHAIDVPVYFPEPYLIPVQSDDEWRKAVRLEFETKWCKPLKASRVPYRTVVGRGRPSTVILDVAERERADVVVVGRRGRSAVGELVLGSVSHELALHSRRPLLLIEPKRARRR